MRGVFEFRVPVVVPLGQPAANVAWWQSASLEAPAVFMEEWLGKPLEKFAAGMERRGYVRKWSEEVSIQYGNGVKSWISYWWEV